MKITIEINKEQYKSFVKALDIGNSVYGVMGDMVDMKYKKISNQTEKLVSQVLRHAENLGEKDIAEKFMGDVVLSDQLSEEIMEDLHQFENFAMWDNLASSLAERDLHKIYNPEELEKMDPVKYFEIKASIEETYNKEFEKHGLSRIGIQKT